MVFVNRIQDVHSRFKIKRGYSDTQNKIFLMVYSKHQLLKALIRNDASGESRISRGQPIIWPNFS